MNKQMIIMLENEDTRYEFYMQGIKRSNVDDTIVRYELQYNYIHNLGLGSSVTYGLHLFGESLEQLIERLLMKGFKPVTYQTKKFA